MPCYVSGYKDKQKLEAISVIYGISPFKFSDCDKNIRIIRTDGKYKTDIEAQLKFKDNIYRHKRDHPYKSNLGVYYVSKDFIYSYPNDYDLTKKHSEHGAGELALSLCRCERESVILIEDIDLLLGGYSFKNGLFHEIKLMSERNMTEIYFTLKDKKYEDNIFPDLSM